MVAPAHSTDDFWHQAITLFTGYPAPERKSLFDKLVGNDNIPLMEVEITDSSATAEDSLYEVTSNLYWRSSNSGASIEEKNIVVPFYAPMNGSQDPAPGTRVKLRQAKIRLLGSSAASSPPMGGVDSSPGDFGTYDDLALKQYSYGGGMALRQLLDEHTTAGFEWNGLQVPLGSAVDTRTFERAADAFSRAAAFFENQSKTLDSWESRLGPDNPVWRGQAAGVFRDLIHKLNKMYGSYQEDIPRVAAAGSKQGKQLMEAQRTFINAMLKLHHKWDWWQIWRGNPLRWLHDNLLDLTKQIWENNITQVKWEDEPDQAFTAPGTMVQSDHRAGATVLVTEPGFRMSHDLYGRYDDLGSWKLIGEQGIREWQNSVITDLGVPARDAIMEVQRAFGISLERVRARSEKSLADDLMADTNKKLQDEQKKKQEEQEKKQEEYLKEQEKKQAEAEKKQEEYLKQQEKERAEQEKKQELYLKEQDKKQEERERKQAEKEAEAERKQELYLQKQEKERAEQERKQEARQAEAERKQGELQAEQEKKQEAYLKQQEQQRAEQERKQEAQQAEAERKQEALRVEQEKRQEQLQAEQEQRQARQQAEQEAQQKEYAAAQNLAMANAKAEQEKERERQTRLQQEQEAKQQQLLKEQEKKQAEQQAEQETRQKEQETRQQQLLEEQKKEQADQQAKQEARQKEQETRQQQLLEEQEKEQADQQAKQEAQQKEQETRQAELEREQEEREKEFQQRLDEQTPSLGIPDFRDSETVLNPDGSLTTDFADGSFTTVDPKEHTAVTVAPDGSVDITDLPDGKTLHNPDGSRTTINPDGTVTTDYPDGRSVTINPERGLVETVYPDGTSEIAPLSPGSSLPDYRDGSTEYTSPYEDQLYDDQPGDESSLLGRANPAAADPMSPTSPMSPMLPTGTMLSGQTSGSNGERSRTVLAGGRTTPAVRTGSPMYDEVTAPGYNTATSSGMPYLPPMGGSPGAPGQGQTETKDRARSAWEPEEEDVWGTDEGGAPASIGR
ncbi:AAWKG family protein [Streptomyces fumanus]|uniref:Microtubule/TRAF3 and DISC1 binding protein n=1 Tax=Streptomyces fumanus TaxID=67302 RepID=A0A919EBT3_9ACTN|nr:AAWKG family protein [Streptomyces fumanus]GHF35400.1 hypothetical protein GCM10018772_70950 [Streptomyces fumanus]